MSVEILDSATIVSFVEDEEAFRATITEHFRELDVDRDGVLSYGEMLRELQSLRVLETHFGVDVKPDPEELSSVYASLFSQFDRDCNGKIDLGEFMAETRKMMLGMANGIGLSPVRMVLEENSFLKKAVDRESTKLPVA
ncbi:uncharacterized protein LOC111468345 [Cucurbita maxima]|uniref:Uncharacterized protein LOC111468345 n=1 Tax=Cucurbita maxima TaxID=3661 RepID=A0A6J1HXE4_CUCMA|nr:uncharacterized protein LOC111468345 [Cucurbita maxima]